MGQRRIDELQGLTTGLEESDLMLVGVQTSPGVFQVQKVVIADLIAMLGFTPDRPGTIRISAGPTIWPGYLRPDGSEILRTAYPKLYEEVGPYCGQGNGTTTWNLPDYTGRTLIGAGSGAGLTPRSLGQKGGSEAMQQHDHDFRVSNDTSYATGDGTGYLGSSANLGRRISPSPYTMTQAVLPEGTGNSGNMPPFAVVYYLIKY